MADRFPSIEEFSAGQVDTKGEPGLDLDPTAASQEDFLSREKAALGDDANQFASASDKFKPTIVEDGDDDLLGGGSGTGSAHLGGDEVSQFTSSFPSIDTRNEHVAPGGSITGVNDLAARQPTPSYHVAEDEEEPEVIKEWRERRDADIERREEAAAKKKAETVKAAQINIDEFYENYNTKKEKQVAQTRKEAEQFLANREDTAAGGTSWERIAKLVDLSGKGARGGASGTGKERFRELLINLKKDEKAPGATGY